MLDLLERSTAIVGAPAARCATCAGLCGLVRAFVRTDGSRNPPCSVGPATEPDVRASRCRSEEHTSELQSRGHLVCRLLLEKKNSPKPMAIAIVYTSASRL